MSPSDADPGEPPRFADEQLASLVSEPAPAFAQLDVAAMRAGIAERARSRPKGPELAEVRDLRIEALRARLYRPVRGRLCLVVYLHGGGWTIGDVGSFDRMCRRLAAHSGCAVLCPEYRLAPEHPWPASVDDAVATLRWVAAQPAELGALSGRVAVAGDSAGGTLAALSCLRLRGSEPGARPDLQVLLYPNTDLADDSPSMRDKAAGFGLGVDAIHFFNAQWVPDRALWSDPRVSPLRATDVSGLPAALIVTAEHDPLRDQGEAYARRLTEAGVAVTLRREVGLIHNFMLLDEISPAAAAAADRVATDIGRVLARAIPAP
ncbi:MAG: alpha/beta hydrolase [Solirubrobacteraceae bacterium]